MYTCRQIYYTQGYMWKPANGASDHKCVVCVCVCNAFMCTCRPCICTALCNMCVSLRVMCAHMWYVCIINVCAHLCLRTLCEHVCTTWSSHSKPKTASPHNIHWSYVLPLCAGLFVAYLTHIFSDYDTTRDSTLHAVVWSLLWLLHHVNTFHAVNNTVINNLTLLVCVCVFRHKPSWDMCCHWEFVCVWCGHTRV